MLGNRLQTSLTLKSRLRLHLVLQLSFLSKWDVVFYHLKIKGCVKGIERSIGIVVEVGRVLRVEREEVGHVPALLDVNMIDHLPLLPPNQSHLKRRKVFLIITTRNWKGKRCAIIVQARKCSVYEWCTIIYYFLRMPSSKWQTCLSMMSFTSKLSVY